MLEKELKQSIDAIKESKTQLINMNLDILKVTNEISESRIKAIDLELEKEELTEEDRCNFIEEKSLLEAEIAKNIESMEKENNEILEVGKELNISEGSRYTSIFELLDDLNKKIDTEGDEVKKEKLNLAVSLIVPTITLENLSDYTINRNPKYFRDNFDKMAKELQTKLAKDSKFIYPSCLQLKRHIKDVVKTQNPDIDEKELNKKSKSFTGFVISHLSKVDLKNEGLYVYYFLQNIYGMEKFPIDKQFEYRKHLVNILDNKLYNK